MNTVNTVTTSYSLNLVPKKGQQIITDDLLNGDHYLAKWVETDADIQTADKKIDAGVIDIKRIPGCSCNKIPDSKPSDLNFKFKPEFAATYNSTWIEGTDGLFPEDSHFDIVDKRKHYSFKIADLHNYKDKYVKNVGKTPTPFNFTVKIVHKPLIANYWHFEFDVDTASDGKVVSSDSAWRKAICSSIRSQMVRVASVID